MTAHSMKQFARRINIRSLQEVSALPRPRDLSTNNLAVRPIMMSLMMHRGAIGMPDND